MIFDLPFGILDASVANWDSRKYNQEELMRLLMTFALINTSGDYHVAFVCDWRDMGTVAQALKEKDFKDITPVYWKKESHTQVCKQS